MEGESALRVGTDYLCISPPVGVELSGYGFYLNRKSQSVRRHLYARALVLEQEGTRVALLTADLIAVSAEITERTRRAVAELTDIPPENVLLACSHTHSGPATRFIRGCGEADPDYVAMLPRYFATLIGSASEDLEPVTLRYGQTDLYGLARNRVDPRGAVDTTVQALEFIGEDSAERTALFSFGCHPVTTLSRDAEIGPDFPERACSLINEISHYREALFLQGSCGDINPTMAHTDLLQQRRAAQMLAGAALVAMAQSEEVVSVRPLRCARRAIALPLALPSREELERRRDDSRALLTERDPASDAGRYARFRAEAAESLLSQLPAPTEQSAPPTLACELQAIQIGDVVLLAHPTELFAEFGLEIKRRSPFPHTFVVGYANDFLGYLPDEAEFARRGYAADTVPDMLDLFPFAPDVARVFTEACLRFLNDLYRSDGNGAFADGS